MKIDLINGGSLAIRDFAVSVVGLACRDHREKYRRRSGKEIIEATCSQSRIFHKRMASGIYNQTRQTRELQDNPPD